MVLDRTTRIRLLTILLPAGLLFAFGCGPSTSDVDLLPVSLPNLDGLVEAAQEQIRGQHARIQAAPDNMSSEVLGLEYGKFGQLLLAYDFLEAAEPALRNAQTLHPQEGSWAYYMGILYRQQGDYAQSAARYEHVLNHTPGDALAHLRLAEAYLELGRTEAAQARLKTVLQMDPKNALAHFLLGQIAYEGEDFNAAVDHYETVLTLQPAATRVHVPLGMAYRNLGDPEQSRRHLSQRGEAPVLLNDPRVLALEALKQATGATALNRGMALMEAGRHREAIAALEQAVANDPTRPSNFLNLGVARSYAGDQEGAVEAFQQALRLDPANSKAHFNLAAIWAAMEQQDQAEEAFRAAVAADPRNGEGHLELAELLRRSRRCGEALPHYEAALEIAPGHVAARQHQALCHLRLGEYRQARALLEAGLAANPTHLGFIDALGRVLATSPEADVRDGERALQLARQGLMLQRRTETLETLAMAYAEQGRYTEALTWQNEALRAAEQLGHAAYLTHLKKNLQRYQRQTASRTPWPDFMYEL